MPGMMPPGGAGTWGGESREKLPGVMASGRGKFICYCSFIDAGGGSVVECANEFPADFLPQPACSASFWANYA